MDPSTRQQYEQELQVCGVGACCARCVVPGRAVPGVCLGACCARCVVPGRAVPGVWCRGVLCQECV